MSAPIQQAEHSSLNFHDLLFILFRHKWKISFFTMAGIAAAVALYFILPRFYEADAKLLVRYVVDKSAVDAAGDSSVRSTPQSDTMINSEVEIMTTLDLAKQVAQAVGVDRLLRETEAKGPQKSEAKGPEEAEARLVQAGRTILGGLKVTAVSDTDIIFISYKNKDPKLALQVLQELVTRYFDKHLEVHRSIDTFEFAKRETDQLGTRLMQSEEELKQLKAKAGISSLAEITTTVNAELVKGQDELDAAKAEFAAQQARVTQIEKWLAGAGVTQPDSATREPSSDVIHEYQALVSRANFMRQSIIELQAKYTPGNPLVKVKQALLNDLEKQQWDLERKFPNLVARLPATASQQNLQSDLGTQKAQLAATEARIEALKARLSSLQEKAKTIWNLGPQIAQLERQRDVEEKDYKYYEAALEQARIDETLNPSRMPNINVVQKPVLAEKASGNNRPEFILGAAGSGLALGIALALLNEMLLDRSVKRRGELELGLRVPLLLSIPYLGRNGQLRLRMHNGDKDAVGTDPANAAPWESYHPVRPFCEAIRDRLIFHFESNGMTHKPKLVGLTGCSAGAGASTIAAGLAAAFSEMCDGKVLLVDKDFNPRRFYAMIAQLKASDFEYVVIDMPSISGTSSTLAMAGVMDKVLLVVEAEVSNREVVRRAYAELTAAKADVAAIFNKIRSYGPKWLECEV
jgi:polysaccharide biosynthesis transport protein